jgi:hypothetical protein
MNGNDWLERGSGDADVHRVNRDSVSPEWACDRKKPSAHGCAAYLKPSTRNPQPGISLCGGGGWGKGAPAAIAWAVAGGRRSLVPATLPAAAALQCCRLVDGCYFNGW